MTNQWFRMYHEFATDPKIQMLSEADQRRYVMLLCLRCCNGDVTLHETEVAFQLRISNEEWASTKAVLIEKGLIDEDNKPTAWDKRQYISDSSRARVAKHRARKNKAKKQECNVTVTPPDTDTDTDKEKDKKEMLPPNGDVFELEKTRINKQIDFSESTETSFDLPDWIDPALFCDFLHVRKKLRAVNSLRAVKSLVTEIEKHSCRDPTVAETLITKAITSSWKTVYPSKQQKTNMQDYERNAI